MRKTVILEFPSNLGLKEPEPGKEPGVRKMPEHFRKYGFHDAVNPVDVIRLEPPLYSMNLHAESGVRNASAIAAYARLQARVLTDVLAEKLFPVVLGGDCSIAIGHALALRQAGRYGLFYLDGHTDFILPELSQTGGAAGMDLAFIAGRGHAVLSNIDGLQPYMREEHIWCVGNREYEEEYTGYIKASGIGYYDLDTVRNPGPQQCVNEFLAMVESEKLDGFWIHLDVDVLHNELMPAVDSPDPGGMSYEEMEKILRPLLSAEKLAGIDITILDPDLDEEGKYAGEFIEKFVGCFGGLLSRPLPA